MLGRAAEARAAEFLEARHFRILLRNFRCRFGELDLVALAPDGVLVIVEVRCRSSAALGGAIASVDRHKQRRLVLATRHLLARRPALCRRATRFDVIAIEETDDVRWIPHAFDA